MEKKKRQQTTEISNALDLILHASAKYPLLQKQIAHLVIETLEDLWENVFSLIVLYRINDLDKAAEKAMKKEKEDGRKNSKEHKA